LFFRVTPDRVAQQQSQDSSIRSAGYALSRDARDVSGEIKLHQGTTTGAQKLHVLHAAEECALMRKEKARRSAGLIVAYILSNGYFASFAI
jgi:hypothetical protein